MSGEMLVVYGLHLIVAAFVLATLVVIWRPRHAAASDPVVYNYLSDYNGNVFQRITLESPVRSYLLTERGTEGCWHGTHPNVSYLRTDSTWGPGWMSDSYKGTACAGCGKILEERKVY